MSHSRDIFVVHTISNKIIFDIPLHFEKGMIFKDARIESGRMLIYCDKPPNNDLKFYSGNKVEEE